MKVKEKSKIPSALQVNPFKRPPSLRKKNHLQNSNKRKKSSFKPVKSLILSFLGFCVILCAQAYIAINTYNGDYSESSEYISYSAEDIDKHVKIGQYSAFKDGDNLVVTIPIEKQIRGEKFYLPYIEYDLTDKYGNEVVYTHYADTNLSSIGYFNDLLYVSFPVEDIPNDISDLNLNIYFDEDSDMDVTEIQDDWIFDDYEYKITDVDDAMTAYKRINPMDFYNLEITDDSVARQDGYITFMATTLDGDKEYISGKANVLFKKDGQVIFGDIVDYESPYETTAYKVNYHAQYPLPEYDEVEVIDMP